MKKIGERMRILKMKSRPAGKVLDPSTHKLKCVCGVKRVSQPYGITE